MGGLSLTTAPHILPVKFRGEKRGPRGDKGTLLARGGPEALSKTRERERDGPTRGSKDLVGFLLTTRADKDEAGGRGRGWAWRPRARQGSAPRWVTASKESGTCARASARGGGVRASVCNPACKLLGACNRGKGRGAARCYYLRCSAEAPAGDRNGPSAVRGGRQTELQFSAPRSWLHATRRPHAGAPA